MTKQTDTPGATTTAADAPTSAADLIETPGPELAGGGKSPTLAADAADLLASGGSAAPDDPAPAPAQPIGRSSPRAKAGFNNSHSKAELIKRGRELAKYAAELEAKVGKAGGVATEEGDDGATAAVVAIDASALVGPMAEVAGVVGDFLSAWRGDHWQFTTEERQKLGSAAAPVIAELAPALGEHATKLTLVLVVLGIAMPRLRKDREEAAKRATA